MAENKIELSFKEIMQQGLQVAIFAPTLKPKGVLIVKIHGVEQGGIWVANQELTDIILKLVHATVSETTPVFFVPFSAISFAWIHVEDLPSSSTKK
jgi:hypothetical protein